MTWTLHVTGYAQAADGERTSNSVELELLAELRAVLSQPRYGASASLLRGVHVVDTAVHRPAGAEAPGEQDGQDAAGVAGRAPRRGKLPSGAPAAAAVAG